MRQAVKKAALAPPEAFGARIGLLAPTRPQAKDIYWAKLKDLSPRNLIATISETHLAVVFRNGLFIQVMGMDKPQRIEGVPLYWCAADEFADWKPGAWEENVRPALSDLQGGAWVMGVPNGRNHFYELWCRAEVDTTGEWSCHGWFSSAVLPESEIEAARRSLDPDTFRQEYEADFINRAGAVYYTFERDHNIARNRIPYDPALDLHLALDFNVAPGVAAILQERALPHPCGREGWQEPETVSCLIDEVYIKKGSNTPLVCDRFLDRFGSHRQELYVYGDATGGNKHTSQPTHMGTDWDLVRKKLAPVFGERLTMRVPRHNPPVRARINALNSRICSMDGRRRFLVSPHAREAIRSLEGTTWAANGIDVEKLAGETVTHLGEAIGYYVHKQFALGKVLDAVQEIA